MKTTDTALVEVRCIDCGVADAFYKNQAPPKDKFVCDGCVKREQEEYARDFDMEL